MEISGVVTLLHPKQTTALHLIFSGCDFFNPARPVHHRQSTLRVFAKGVCESTTCLTGFSSLSSYIPYCRRWLFYSRLSLVKLGQFATAAALPRLPCVLKPPNHRNAIITYYSTREVTAFFFAFSLSVLAPLRFR
jgi:hypothetical protein